VFGIIKSVLDFRQFLRCGLDKVGGAWSLVIMARNRKRMFALAAANRVTPIGQATDVLPASAPSRMAVP
jgi:hypothetical protein